jgi:AmpD protein
LLSSVTLEPASGWFADIERVVSPNFDARPEGVVVDLVVVHAISLPPGEFGGGNIECFFKNQLDSLKHSYFRSIEDLEVSAHLLIDRSGLLKQFVSTKFRAWHCGDSSFDGRGACNDYSIGIELEGSDEHPFTPAQYEMLADVLIEVSVHYPLASGARIVGHSDIAPGRKTDPGPCFDWQVMRNMMQDKRRLREKGGPQ